MSMSRGCTVIETALNRWYCITAVDEYDDDFNHFVVTGPKSNKDDAFDSHDGCNPGGYVSIKNEVWLNLPIREKRMWLKMIEKRRG